MVEEAEPILIVDDNPNNVRLLGATLSDEGYLINIARSGKQALEMVGKSPPGLILLDVMMPEMDGYETCQRLKAMPVTEEIPIIFLTARTEKEAAVKGFRAGAVDYITKPFDSEELLARVHTHLELRQKTQQLLAAYDDLNHAHAEQKRMQLELVEAEKLSTLLETAGGAAHEINQPLQVITAQLELLSIDMGADDPGRDGIAAALEQSSRISDILKSMRQIQRYRSVPYAGDNRIIDFSAASEGE